MQDFRPQAHRFQWFQSPQRARRPTRCRPNLFKRASQHTGTRALLSLSASVRGARLGDLGEHRRRHGLNRRFDAMQHYPRRHSKNLVVSLTYILQATNTPTACQVHHTTCVARAPPLFFSLGHASILTLTSPVPLPSASLSHLPHHIVTKQRLIGQSRKRFCLYTNFPHPHPHTLSNS